MRLLGWLRTPAHVDVRFTDGPLAGQTLPVALKYLDTGVTWKDDDLLHGNSNQTMHMGWGRALGYDFRFTTETRYRFARDAAGAWTASAAR